MKKLIIFCVIIFALMHSAIAQDVEGKKLQFGILVMGGGRYDDVRMCVGSPAGVKGGPIGDVMFSAKYLKSDKYAIVLNIPVMRPILFAVAHEMLQFEPEAVFEIHKPINEKRDFITGPGMGLSLHYGPDYRSDSENPTESFFAAGPIINYQVGLLFKSKIEQSIALKAFYTPLFSAGNHDNGNVVGGALQYAIYF